MWTWFQGEAEAWKEYFIFFSVLNWVTQQQVRLTSKQKNPEVSITKNVCFLTWQQLDPDLHGQPLSCHPWQLWLYTESGFKNKKSFISVIARQSCTSVQFCFLGLSWFALIFGNCYKHHKIKRSSVQEHANEATVWVWPSSLRCTACACKSRRGRCHKTYFLWPALNISFP